MMCLVVCGLCGCVFRRDLKVERESVFQMSSGRKSESRRAEWLTARAPAVVKQAGGEVSWRSEEDQSAGGRVDLKEVGKIQRG